MRNKSLDKWTLGMIGLVALLLLLSMVQVDRQWLKMAQMQRELAQQTQDIQQLRDELKRYRVEASAMAVSPTPRPAAEAPSATTTPAADSAFTRAEQALNGAPAEQRALVLPLELNLTTLTPLISSDVYSSLIQSYVLESLLVRNPDTLQWQGLLAERWAVSEDGLQLDFWLRPEARFADGEPLTAGDVAFSFAMIMDERVAAPRLRAYYQKIQAVEALSDQHVRFTFKQPYYNAMSLAGGLQVMARHYYEPLLQTPQAFNQSKAALMGSGPYQLAQADQWRPDRGRVELLRNPRYWGPVKGPFPSIEWRVIENESARLSSYRNREIHRYDVRPIEYEALNSDAALQANSQFFQYTDVSAGYSYIAWNQTDKAGGDSRFADVRVRRAMTLLIDRQRLVDELLLGFAEVAVSPFSSASQQHDPALQARRPDRQQALALLAEAGYQDRNGDGLLEDAEGRDFAFKLTFFQGKQDTKRVVLLIKDMLAEAGIDLQPEPAEWSVMLEQIDQRRFEAITLGWSSGVESDLYQIFHSSQRTEGGDNFVGYHNPEFDQLVEQARSSVDEPARMALWRRAERFLYEDQPYTFLLRRQSLRLLDRRLANVQTTSTGLNFSSVPVEFYWQPEP